MNAKLKQGQKVFFIVKDEDKRELSYQEAKFMYSESGGPNGRCVVQTEYNGQTFSIPVPRSLIFTTEKDVRDQVYITAMLHGWRAAI